MNYAALIADIVGSRKMTDQNRYKLQLFIKAILNYLNKLFALSLKSAVEISAGDSMQGLFTNSLAAYLYFRQMQMLIYPIIIRGGIGVGTIYYDENWKSSELEGPAYYRARQALEIAYQTQLCYLANDDNDKYINSYMQLTQDKDTITTNLIKVMAEIFFPLYQKDIMQFHDYSNNQAFLEVMKWKEEFYNIIKQLEGQYVLKGIYPDVKNFKLPSLSDCEIIDIKELYQKSIHPEIIDCFWKRGFSNKISQALNNTTRQNVDNHLDNTIKKQRNLEGTIALLLMEGGFK